MLARILGNFNLSSQGPKTKKKKKQNLTEDSSLRIEEEKN
jgi:hypothetical protein